MPSTSLQSRINAFEALGGPSSSSPSPTSLPRNIPKQSPKLSQNLLESPISPTASSFSPIEPFTPPKAISRSPSPSPPNLGRKTSLIDLKDWVIDDGIPSQRQNGDWNANVGRYKQYQRTPRHIPENTASRTKSIPPLINLEPPPKSKPDKAPPLPPRKPSYSSLKSASSSNSVGSRNGNSNGATLRPPSRSDSLAVEHTYPPLSQLNTDASRKSPSHAPASSISSFHSVSLSSDGGTTDVGTPGSATNFIATYPMDRENSGGGDADSLDESYENVSTMSAISPTNTSFAFDWDRAMSKKSAPPLPQRPGSKRSPTISPSISASPPPRSMPNSPPLRPVSSSSSSATARRPAPPPPPPHARHGGSGPPSSRTSLTSTSASDRSSIFSTTSRTSISTRASTQAPMSKYTSLLRPTPVPASAMKRYERVFVGNVLQRRKTDKAKAISKPELLSPQGTRKTRQAAGWRGLSVDLITNPEDHPLTPSTKENEKEEGEDEDIIGPDERLDGHAIKLVWSASKLDKGKLREIWNECDSTRQGSLDRDAFVKGMWRIDEELRRAQLSRSSGSSQRVRLPPKPPSMKLILR